MGKTVLITGTSSGIGRATVEYFSNKGWNVTATMRNPSSEVGQKLAQLPNVHVTRLDVTDRASIKQAVSETLENFSALHVAVNNAGYGLAGPMEFATEEELTRQFSTNVLGPVYVMQEVLPHMKSRKEGTIVNITSVGGRIILPFNSLYHGAKFALEGISEGACLELAPLGIRMKVVEPGSVRTDFAGRSLSMTSKEGDHSYDAMIASALAVFQTRQKPENSSDPSDIAAVIFEAASDQSDRLRFLAGPDARKMVEERNSVSDEEYQKIMTERFNLGGMQ